MAIDLTLLCICFNAAALTSAERISGRSGTVTRNCSVGSTGSRVKLAEFGRPSVSLGNYSSSQHSFDYFHVAADKLDTFMGEKIASEESESNIRKLKTLSFGEELPVKTSTKAPLISISAILGDIASDSSIIETTVKLDDSCSTEVAKEEKEIAVGKEESESNKDDSLLNVEADIETRTQVGTQTKESLEEAQVVPVWEPDTQQGDQTAPATQPVSQQKCDNNVNEVCPWEDE